MDQVAEGDHGLESGGESHKASGGSQAEEAEEVGDSGGED